MKTLFILFLFFNHIFCFNINNNFFYFNKKLLPNKKFTTLYISNNNFTKFNNIDYKINKKINNITLYLLIQILNSLYFFK